MDVVAPERDSITLTSINLITGLYVGTHAIVPGAMMSENFDITYELGTLTISPTDLVVAINDTAIGYGSPVAFTLLVTGYQYSDSDSVLFTSPVYSIQDSASNIVSSSGIPLGNYSVTPDVNLNSLSNYTLTEESGTLTIIDRIIVNIKMFLEGYYTGSGMMDNYGSVGLLNLLGISPYSQDVDTVIVSAMDSTTFEEIDRKSGILKTDGTVNINFTSPVAVGEYYYLKINHRNTIETWSSVPVYMTGNSFYNFTDSLTKAYGNNMIQTQDQLGFAFYSGDISDAGLGMVGLQDGLMDGQDYSDMENAVYNILTGYITEDITGDGVVEGLDYSIMENNVYYVIYLIRPY